MYNRKRDQQNGINREPNETYRKGSLQRTVRDNDPRGKDHEIKTGKRSKVGVVEGKKARRGLEGIDH